MEKMKDPVCGMSCDIDYDTVKATYKGKTYYFCAEGCKAEFERDPEKYVKEHQQGSMAAHEH